MRRKFDWEIILIDCDQTPLSNLTAELKAINSGSRIVVFSVQREVEVLELNSCEAIGKSL